MTNSIKKCTTCNGTGLINQHKMDARGGSECPTCEGLGTPLFDETFDNAKSFLGEEDNDNFIDLDEE